MVKSKLSMTMLIALIVLMPLTMSTDDKSTEEEEVDYNAAARTFENYVKKYLSDNGFDQKETIDRETFIALFMNVTSSEKQNIQVPQNTFEILANTIADKAGSPIKTKDIPSILNLNEMVFLYSSIVEENNITFEDETREEISNKTAEYLKKIKEDL